MRGYLAVECGDLYFEKVEQFKYVVRIITGSSSIRIQLVASYWDAFYEQKTKDLSDATSRFLRPWNMVSDLIWLRDIEVW